MRLNVHTTVGMVCGKRTCGVRDKSNGFRSTNEADRLGEIGWEI